MIGPDRAAIPRSCCSVHGRASDTDVCMCVWDEWENNSSHSEVKIQGETMNGFSLYPTNTKLLQYNVYGRVVLIGETSHSSQKFGTVNVAL